MKNPLTTLDCPGFSSHSIISSAHRACSGMDCHAGLPPEFVLPMLPFPVRNMARILCTAFMSMCLEQCRNLRQGAASEASAKRVGNSAEHTALRSRLPSAESRRRLSSENSFNSADALLPDVTPHHIVFVCGCAFVCTCVCVCAHHIASCHITSHYEDDSSCVVRMTRMRTCACTHMMIHLPVPRWNPCCHPTA